MKLLGDNRLISIACLQDVFALGTVYRGAGDQLTVRLRYPESHRFLCPEADRYVKNIFTVLSLVLRHTKGVLHKRALSELWLFLLYTTASEKAPNYRPPGEATCSTSGPEVGGKEARETAPPLAEGACPREDFEQLLSFCCAAKVA